MDLGLVHNIVDDRYLKLILPKLVFVRNMEGWGKDRTPRKILQGLSESLVEGAFPSKFTNVWTENLYDRARVTYSINELGGAPRANLVINPIVREGGLQI